MAHLDRFVDSERLPDLEETLWEWVHVCERDSRLEQCESASWWYNETTSVGMFAGAIWRCGGTALSDFSMKRFDLESAQRTADDKSRHGRCDLYFRLKQSAYYVEAKQVWSPFGLQADFRLNDIETGFIKAFSQLDRLDKGRASKTIADEQKFALVFVVPYISKSYEPHINARLGEWQQAVQQIKCDALAWTFPSKTRTLEERGKNRCFPGIALMIRKFKQPDYK